MTESDYINHMEEIKYINRLKGALPIWICYEKDDNIFAAFRSEVAARHFFDSLDRIDQEMFYIQDTTTDSKLRKQND